jgi:hypothetical protein
MVCWPLTWLLPGARSHVLFFPLWLGYILVVDALVKKRRDSSLLSRSPRALLSLFLASVPIWWLFELLNRRVGSWEYLGGEGLSDTEYVFWASLSFSTVVPAVFETAELVSTFVPPERFQGRGREIPPWAPPLLIATGAALVAVLLYLPAAFYPFLWVFPLLLFDPLARALGRPSLLGHLERGAFGPLLCLSLGALVCGPFWELWNFYSYPKWIYHVPGLDFAHIFEMPALGYLGYLPFGASLYPMTNLLLGPNSGDALELSRRDP